MKLLIFKRFLMKYLENQIIMQLLSLYGQKEED